MSHSEKKADSHVYNISLNIISWRLWNPLNYIQCPYHTYMRCFSFSTFNCCGWAYGCTLTSLPPQTFPQIWERVLGWNPRWFKCYSMVEAVEPFRLHPTSMPYIHKVFEHLQLLWMVEWLHTHTITTTYIFLDLRELANILGVGGDVNEQTMLLYNGWGCRPFQTVSHINVIHTFGVSSTFNWCGWANNCTLTPLPPQTFPQIWESSWLKLRWCTCINHDTTLWLRM